MFVIEELEELSTRMQRFSTKTSLLVTLTVITAFVSKDGRHDGTVLCGTNLIFCLAAAIILTSAANFKLFRLVKQLLQILYYVS